MVFSHMKKLWSLTTTSLLDQFESRKVFNQRGKAKRNFRQRHLGIDSLEDRMLLSLTVATATDVLVNTNWQDIRGDISVASNEAGDVVVAWTAADALYKPSTTASGSPQYLTDNQGNPIVDLNVYARYLTNEVQRLSLDSVLVPTGSSTTGGSFELVYDSAAVQKLKFTTATNPNGYDELMYGTVNLGLWIDNQLVWGYSSTDIYDKGRLFTFDEYLTPAMNATNLQEYLRTNTRFLGKYSEVTVVAINEREFNITFNGYEGQQLQEIRVHECNFSSGFAGGAIVSTVSSPTLVTSYNQGTGAAIGITVYSDPWQTAQAIQNTINSATQFVVHAPISRPWYYDQTSHIYVFAGNAASTYVQQSGWNGTSGVFSELEVRVVPVTVFNATTGKYELSKTMFDIEFVGNSGLQDQQLLTVKTMKQKGSSINIVSSNLFSVETIKQSSPVFRVNAAEPAEFLMDVDDNGDPVVVIDEYGDPILLAHGKLNQYKAVVAMDDSGEFTIAWEAAVKDITDPNNTTDIYARRFAVQGIVSAATYDQKVGYYVDGGYLDITQSRTYVPQANKDPYQLDVPSVAQAQGVRPLAEQFRVNVSTNGAQTDPAISCDGYGDFVISWTVDAQWNSYFAGISARWFNNVGLAITGDVAITSQNVPNGTPFFGPSYVATSSAGYTVVLYLFGNNLYKSVFGPVTSTQNAIPFVNRQLVANNAYAASVDFDSNDRYVISFTQAETGRIVSYTDVYAVGYQITRDTSTSYSETCYTSADGSPFLVNQQNANATLGSGTQMADQGRSSVGVDADGDMFFSYQGYGPDFQYTYYINNAIAGLVPFASGGVEEVMSFLFSQDLVYFHRAVTYAGKIAYEGKNDDLLGSNAELSALLNRVPVITNFDVPSLYTNGILYKSLAYANTNYAVNAVDSDTYIRACLVGAQKAGANADQIGRLNAMLSGMVNKLAGAGNDILFSMYNNQGTALGGDNDGVVNDYRDGINAKMVIAVPTVGITAATMTIELQRLDRYWSVAGALIPYFSVSFAVPVDTNGNVNLTTLRTNIQSAFNDLEDEGYRDYSFFVSNITNTVGDWNGTMYDTGLGTMAPSGWQIFEITFQNDAHDAPYRINYPGTSLVYTPTGTGTTAITLNSTNGGIYSRAMMTQTGSYGTAQINSHVSVTNSGNVAVVWAQQQSYWTYALAASNGNITGYVTDTYSAIGNSYHTQSQQIYLRLFKESTDTAGPVVTKVALPDGTVVKEGGTVTSTVKNLVVSFDETLFTKTKYPDAYSQLHSVDNLSNWNLLCDGIIVQNAIESITFGLSASRLLAENSTNSAVSGGLLALGTNKWEAVITFKDGYELTTGNYTLVARSAIQDISRNALNSQGLNYAGQDYTITFSVISLNKPLAFDTTAKPYINGYVPEYVVNTREIGPTPNPLDNPTYDHSTRNSALDDTDIIFDTPNTPTSVASDANGNFVVVWSSTLEDANAAPLQDTGIWVKVYRQVYVTDSVGKRTSVTEVLAEFKIAGTAGTTVGNATYYAQQASVAMDDQGNFVVVWDQYNTTTNSREVYARRYNVLGDEIGINGYIGSFLINVETAYDQQNASVAMDADGDFVVVWESFGQDYDKQKTWGIYGRRFTNDGYSFGITDTQQTITIGGEIITDSYVFNLTYTDEWGRESTTSWIDLKIETNSNAKNIYDALMLLTDASGNYIFAPGDLSVSVIGANQILVTFGGRYANSPIDLLTSSVRIIKSDKTLDRTTAISVNVTATSAGSSGAEFLINETIENHQRFPSVAMDAVGNFVVTWTAWGQDGDTGTTETNIYGKRFVANQYLQSKASTQNFDITYTISASGATSYIIGSSNAVLNTNSGDSQYTGVGLITVRTGTGTVAYSYGSGALLSTGSHVLTAAHVIWNDLLATPYAVGAITVTFEVAGVQHNYYVQSIYVHPSYNGNEASSSDIAILQLTEQCISSIDTYEIYRDSNELGQIFTRVGYGYYGLGGDLNPALRGFGVKHWGQNKYELTANEINATYLSAQLVYDFDDGTVSNDWIGNNFGLIDKGLGANEASAAPGDSGGPNFINGKIAGVTSWGISGQYGPVYGSYGVDVRVSSYATWIDSILIGGIGGEFLVNEGAEIGYQIWSDVAVDDSGNFVVTWTSYGQDGHGDSLTGPTRNGVGGIYARRFFVTSDLSFLANPVFLVNDFTENDQIHSKISMSETGDFVIAWESFQDRDNLSSDIPNSFGVYAKRYVNTSAYFVALAKVNGLPVDNSGKPVGWNYFPAIPAGLASLDIPDVGKVGIFGEYGSEFCVEDIYGDQTTNGVNSSVAGDQVGISVALNKNGDMIFVWTNLGVRIDRDGLILNGSDVVYRTITLADDNSPPTVTSVQAIYPHQGFDDTVSLFKGYNFAEGEAPKFIEFTFSETMFSAQMVAAIKAIDVVALRSLYPNERDFRAVYSAAIMTIIDGTPYSPETTALKSILNPSNWSLLKDGVQVFTSHYAGVARNGLLYSFDTDRGCLVLTIDFTEFDDRTMSMVSSLGPGSYVLTLSDAVTDLFNNRLDGDYDGKAGGSFSVRFTVAGDTHQDNPGGNDEPAGDASLSLIPNIYGYNYPDVASYIDELGRQHFIITVVQERLVEYDAALYALLNSPKLVMVPELGTDPYFLVTDLVMYEYYETPAGKIIGSTEIIVTNAFGNQYNPSIATTASGSFVIGWTGSGTNAREGVYANFYVDGKVYPRFISNSAAVCKDVNVSISGEYVLITWIQGNTTSALGNGDKVMGRLYQVNGTPLTDIFMVVDGGMYSVDNFTMAGAQDPKSEGISERFGITWSVYDPTSSNRTTDVYAMVLTGSSLLGASATTAVTPTINVGRVNKLLPGAQDDPQIAMDNKGNFFITWTSTVNGEADIYGRAFNANGSSRSLLGVSSQEVRINTTTQDRQIQSDVSVSPDGANFLVTWTSYSIEKSNYDPKQMKELYDNGIAARLFDASGVNVVAAANPLDKTTNDWNVNGIHNGDQYIPSCTVFNNGSSSTQRFAIVWTGPFIEFFPGARVDSDVIFDNSSYDAEPGVRLVFFKYYPEYNYGGNIFTDQSLTDQSFSAVRSFSVDSVAQVNTGYYNPSANIVQSTPHNNTDSSVYVISGTKGADLLVVNMGSSMTNLVITLNGKAVVIPAGTKSIQFDGLDGNDTITFVGTSGNDTVVVNAAYSTIMFNGIGFAWNNTENLNIDTKGGTDQIRLATSRSDDQLTVAPGSLELLCGNGFVISALNFEEVFASSTAGNDTVLLRDSKEDDQFEFSDNYAVLNGNGFSHEVYGFNSVRVIATEGNDTIKGAQVRNIFATESILVAQTAKTSYILSNFDGISLEGVAGSQAIIQGSTGDDYLEASQLKTRFVWSAGTVFVATNIQSLTVNGNGGTDIAKLTNTGTKSSSFVGHETTCTWINGGATKTLNSFARVQVAGSASAWDSAVLYDTSADDVLSLYGDNATLNSGGSDIYQLLAFDQVTAKKEQFGGSSTVRKLDTINFAFETDSWNKDWLNVEI